MNNQLLINGITYNMDHCLAIDTSSPNQVTLTFPAPIGPIVARGTDMLPFRPPILDQTDFPPANVAGPGVKSGHGHGP